ncbi:calcium-binding protein [uncultured Tateyamaria sp.]|uniref:calcium-binding protein n=1 Tax=uncultured Tateyamaria sp. TaxID=455651 RepID=UPI00262AD68E|nr:calcium-binding protein [uncultured Tateyamaria sp.]
MPTDYVEDTSFPNGTDRPYTESFNGGVPIDFQIGDTVSGNVGVRYLGGPDNQDQISFNVQAGVAYGFEVTVQKSGSDVRIAIGEDSVEIPFTEPEGKYTFTLGLPYDANGIGALSISAGSSVNYTFTVLEVIYPDPSEGDDYIVGNMTSDRVDLLGGNDTYVALGGSDIVIGGLGNDSIDGVCGNDTLEGDDGSDTLIGGNGSDVLFGGADNDLLDGGNQEDRLDGGAGNDTLIGEKGDDTLVGGEGDDDINGGKDNDSMTGGTGADIFRFSHGDGQDTISDFTRGEDLIDLTVLGIWDIMQLTVQDLGSGVRVNTGNGNYIELTGLTTRDLTNDDFMLVDPPVTTTTDGADDITGTGAADMFLGGDGADRLRGEGGRDTLDGGSGRDTIYGGAGPDGINGGSGQDVLYGGLGADTILGGADNDRLYGDEGADVLDGGNANDRLYGGEGSDVLTGENGNDKLYGEGGRDNLMGGAGKDTLEGGAGRDTLDGGQGDDILTGGADADLFVFSDDRTRADTITDFNANVDVIDLTALGFSSLADVGFVQQGDDVFARFSDRDSLLLLDVDLADLNAMNVLVGGPAVPVGAKRDDVVGPSVADVEDVFIF